MKPSSKNHWRVEGTHPDKKEPFDTYINFYKTQAAAQGAKEEIERQGYEYVTIIPPGNLMG
jgi:hypothetical protein